MSLNKPGELLSNEGQTKSSHQFSDLFLWAAPSCAASRGLADESRGRQVSSRLPVCWLPALGHTHWGPAAAAGTHSSWHTSDRWGRPEHCHVLCWTSPPLLWASLFVSARHTSCFYLLLDWLTQWDTPLNSIFIISVILTLPEHTCSSLRKQTSSCSHQHDFSAVSICSERSSLYFNYRRQRRLEQNGFTVFSLRTSTCFHEVQSDLWRARDMQTVCSLSQSAD